MAKITAAQVKELRDLTGVGMMDAKNALVETEGNLDDAISLLREKGLAASAKKAGRIAAEGITAVKVDGNKAALIEVNAETDFVAKNDRFQELVEDIITVVLNNNPADLEAALALDLKGQSVENAISEATSVIGEKITLRRFEVFEKSDADAFGSYVHMGGRISALVLLEGTTDEDVANDVAMHIAAINPRFVRREDVPAEEVAKETEIQKELALNEGRPENVLDRIVEGRLNKWYSEICLEDQDFVKDSDQKVADFVKKSGGKIAKFARYEVGEGLERRSEDFAAEVAEQMRK